MVGGEGLVGGEVVVVGNRMGRTRNQSKSGHWIGWSIWRGSRGCRNWWGGSRLSRGIWGEGARVGVDVSGEKEKEKGWE